MLAGLLTILLVTSTELGTLLLLLYSFYLPMLSFQATWTTTILSLQETKSSI